MAEHLHLTVRFSAAALAAAPALPGRLIAAITDRRYRVAPSPSVISTPAGDPAGFSVYREHGGPALAAVKIQLADDGDPAPPCDTDLVITLPVDIDLQQESPTLDQLVLDRLEDADLLASLPVASDAHKPGGGVYTDTEEAVVARRLAALGYIE